MHQCRYKRKDGHVCCDNHRRRISPLSEAASVLLNGLSAHVHKLRSLPHPAWFPFCQVFSAVNYKKTVKDGSWIRFGSSLTYQPRSSTQCRNRSVLRDVLCKVGCRSKFENTVELFHDGRLRQPLCATTVPRPHETWQCLSTRNMAVS